MKFTVNCDCTPEEARRFFGLPDAEQINENMMETMKAWQPQNFHHFQELQQMIWDQMGAALNASMPQTYQAETEKKSDKK